MKINCAYSELVDLHKLVPHPKNANKHSEQQLDLLTKLIDFQGFRHPVIVSKLSGFIVAGHARLQVAQKLGYSQVPVDYQDFDNEAQEYAFLVSDNTIQELSETDLSLVNLHSMDLGPDFDLDLLGIPDFLIDLNEIDPPEMSSGDKITLKQITFTVTDEQDEQIQTALKKSKSMGIFLDTGNENSNGNALARICETYETIG